MTGVELKSLRIGLGFRTQADLAAELDVSRETVARWESGKTPIPRTVEKLLELMKEAEK